MSARWKQTQQELANLQARGSLLVLRPDSNCEPDWKINRQNHGVWGSGLEPALLLYDDLSFHLPMSRTAKLAAIEFELAGLIGIELDGHRRSGLELDATLFH